MKIVIIGDGKVGHKLTTQLSEEDYDITLIDQNAGKLKAALNNLDIFCINGNGADAEVLKQADVPHADIVIACTSTKNHIIHGHRYNRLYQCPQKSKIRTGITLFKVIFGKLPDQLPALEKFPRNDKHPVIIHTEDHACQQKKCTGTEFLQIFRVYIWCQRIIMADYHNSHQNTDPPENTNSHRLWNRFQHRCQ